MKWMLRIQPRCKVLRVSTLSWYHSQTDATLEYSHTLSIPLGVWPRKLQRQQQRGVMFCVSQWHDIVGSVDRRGRLHVSPWLLLTLAVKWRAVCGLYGRWLVSGWYSTSHCKARLRGHTRRYHRRLFAAGFVYREQPLCGWLRGRPMFGVCRW